MNTDVIVVTCSEQQALPFLLSLPAADLAMVTLVATRDVVSSAERQALVGRMHVIGGMAAIDEVRALVGDARRHVTVIVAPDPWGPFRGKGFVRARVLAPLFLAPDGHADLIELRGDGHSCRSRASLSRRALMLRLWTREACLLTRYLAKSRAAASRFAARRTLAVPITVATAVRLAAFIVRTELQARRQKTQSR